MCCGISLSTNRMVQVGETVGVVAAQSVGEPEPINTKNFSCWWNCFEV